MTILKFYKGKLEKEDIVDKHIKNSVKMGHNTLRKQIQRYIRDTGSKITDL